METKLSVWYSGSKAEKNLSQEELEKRVLYTKAQ